VTFKHIEQVKVNEIFSLCREFRYKLEIEHLENHGTKTVCIIMQNPSIANAKVADKSVQFLEKLIFQKEYSEFLDVKKIIIVNQFAYVQTKSFNGLREHIGSENDEHIREACDKADIILIAWGVSNSFNDRKEAINSIIESFDNKLLLQTKKHPSRGYYDNFIELYNI